MLSESKPDEHPIQSCLRELVYSADKVKGRTGGHLPMVGKYGSNTWKRAVKDQDTLKTAITDTRKVMATLLHHQMSLEEWEGTFLEAAGGVTNEGYIAALQRTIASRADCLVLMGGGSFQEQVLQEYFHVHKEKREFCIEMVCTHFQGK